MPIVDSRYRSILTVSKQTETNNGYVQASREVARMIAALQDFTISVWHHRNNVLHETGSLGREALHATLNHNITQMYHLQSSFASIVQSYFDMSLKDRLRRSPRQRSRWLQLVQLATTHSTPLPWGPVKRWYLVISHMLLILSKWHYLFLLLLVGLIDILATRTVVIGTVAVEPADVTDVAIGSFLTAFRIMIR